MFLLIKLLEKVEMEAKVRETGMGGGGWTREEVELL